MRCHSGIEQHRTAVGSSNSVERNCRLLRQQSADSASGNAVEPVVVEPAGERRFRWAAPGHHLRRAGALEAWLLVRCFYRRGEFFCELIGWPLRLAVTGLRRRRGSVRVGHRRHARHRDQPTFTRSPALGRRLFLIIRNPAARPTPRKSRVSPPECLDRPVSPKFPDHGSAPR